MVNNSNSKKILGGETNSSFLTLIPKELNPVTFSRFCPISLFNSSYKIISKITSFRLKKFLPSLISENQGGFMEKRQIVDNIILVQEAIHTNEESGEASMVIKLDMVNTFDRVRHFFIFKTIRKMGFNEKVVRWISSCISSPWITPLVNGIPVGFFKATRGLWQGCPMLPLLYIIMAKTLSRNLERAKMDKKLIVLSIDRNVKI